MKTIVFALLCLLGTTSSAVDKPLEPLALKVFTFEDDNYAVGLDDKVTWFQAQLICASKDFTLVSIQSQFVQNKTVNWIQTKASDYLSLLDEVALWTSGTNQGDTSEYVWQSSGRSVFFNNFELSPNTTAQHCIGIKASTGVWSDHDCMERKYFICEKVKGSKC